MSNAVPGRPVRPRLSVRCLPLGLLLFLSLVPTTRNRPTALWVFLADRPFAGESAREAALTEAWQSLPEGSLFRRTRMGGQPVDDGDLAVAVTYVERIARVARIRQTSRWLNAVSVEVTPSGLSGLLGLPFVSGIRPVARARAAYPVPLLEGGEPARERGPAASPFDERYGPSLDQLRSIGVVAVHGMGFTGARVPLLMIDTGFRSSHLAFRETRLRGQRDFIQHDGNTANGPGDPHAQHDHGTATWSAAAGYAPGRLIGAAYGADFYLAKTESVGEELPWEEDTYIAALEWADSLGVSYTSASLAYLQFDDGSGWTFGQLDGDQTPITRALDRAAARGMLCVNAMGNSGPALRTLNAPADADSMLAVGAVSINGIIAGFSSRGPTADQRTKPEVVAPGVNVRCAVTQSDVAFGELSGTSLATPLVGGACALVQEAHPEWDPMMVRLALISTAQNAHTPDNVYGYGRIDVLRAIEALPMEVATPFSLLSPGDGDSIDAVWATFSWTRSADPQGGPIRYELWVDQDSAFASPQVFAATDTFVTIGEPLPPRSRVHWRVLAEDSESYSRLSREDRSCLTRALPDTLVPPPVVSGWELAAVPNPGRSSTKLRWRAGNGSLGQEVEISLFDAAGRRVFRHETRVDGEGWRELSLDGREGKGLTSGFYVALLRSASVGLRTKLLLIH